jgi:hypothetical protein
MLEFQKYAAVVGKRISVKSEMYSEGVFSASIEFLGKTINATSTEGMNREVSRMFEFYAIILIA